MPRARFCCLLLAACSAAIAAPQLQLVLKDSVAIDGARVRLSALVGSPVPNAVPSALLDADLGAAPLPGYTLRISKAEIARRLRARNLGANVSWSGAQAVSVERLASSSDSTALVAAAQTWLQARLDPLAARVELRPARGLAEVQLPAGAVELRPRPLQGKPLLRPEIVVWLDILVDGAPVRTVAVPFRVSAFRQVLSARRLLGVGTRPGCADLEPVEADVAAFDSPALGPDCAAVAGQLKRTLVPGTPLLAAHLQVPVAVAQGDQVALRVSYGAIELETRALALMDGEVGQRIDVRASSSNRPVNAEVVAPGIVALTRGTP